MDDSSLNRSNANIAASPTPTIVSLRTQLASQGHTKHLLAETNEMTLHIHCYAPKGGENGLHAHTEEDHVFLCLQGSAQFRGIKGEVLQLTKNHAIFLPRGCFYSFSNEGEEPCILVRMGSGPKGYSGARIDPDGKPIAGRSKKAGAIAPVLIDGAFFPE